MVYKHYLTEKEIKENGEDFCKMFFAKDNKGFYNAQYVDTPRQIEILKNIDKLKNTIRKYQNMIDTVKYEIKQLENEYRILDQ